MKKHKIITIIFLVGLLTSLLSGCSEKKKESFDGRDRPSSAGTLQVANGVLSDENGSPVMLRGVSNPGVSISQMFTCEKTYKYISEEMGVNVIRLALYTKGMGVFGYCTGGEDNKVTLNEQVYKAVELAKEHDMYVLIDWHILDDGDPNQFKEEAKIFFDDVSKKYAGYNNVLYEICNEPNHAGDWEAIKTYANEIIPIIRGNDPDSVIIVGTPNYSQDVDIAADDPLEYDNLLYTLHFYSATHKQELRDKAQYAIDKGLALFVSEYGVVASTGGPPRDLDSGNEWVEFLEANNVSYVMWNFSKTGEACAILKSSALKLDGFTEEDFTETGLWLIDTLKKYK